MAKFSNTKGIITRIYNSGDKDKVLHVIKQDGSLLPLIAKNIKSPKSKKQSVIELGNHIQFSYIDGYAVPILSEIKLINDFHSWKTTIKEITLLQLLLEVIGHFAQEDNPEKDLFIIIYESLKSNDLEKYKFIIGIALLKILNVTGNVSKLDICSISGEKISDNFYIQSIDSVGYQAHSNDTDGNIRILKTQNFILSHKFHDCLRISLSDSEIDKLLKIHINWIELVLERELKSKKLLGVV